jgi:symplekin
MAAAAAAGVEDDDEYEPDFEPEDAEQIGNRLDSAPPDNVVSKPVPDAPLAPYKLPEAPPLTQQEVQRYGNETVARAFGMLSAIEDMQKGKASKGGFNRLAASAFDRDSWITILSRLATRASAGLEDPEEGIKSEYGQMSKKGSFSLADHIRDRIYTYIIHDWKRRLDLAISWLNEEWYNDHIEAEAFRRKSQTNGHSSSSSSDGANSEQPPQGNYKRCALRLIDGITTYIEGTDKVLIRFISEVPYLDAEMLGRLRKMAEDPERIDLACLVLQYLYMFRPPVREMVVDCAEELWRTSEWILFFYRLWRDGREVWMMRVVNAC